jgi:hypothetical protein
MTPSVLSRQGRGPCAEAEALPDRQRERTHPLRAAENLLSLQREDVEQARGAAGRSKEEEAIAEPLGRLG